MVNSISTYKAVLMYKQGMDQQKKKKKEKENEQKPVKVLVKVLLLWRPERVRSATGLSFRSSSRAAPIHKSSRVHLVKQNIPRT